MELLKMIEANINDEEGASDGYETMMDAIEQSEELTDEEKSLMTGIVFKIRTDEETHQVLLKILKDVVESKKFHDM